MTMMQQSKRISRGPLAALLFILMGVPSQGLAQTPARDLTQVSLEDLMNIEITSASRKEQRAADVPAAVFVITRDDIRRSGMTTVPDVLRLAPGVEVAQINANKWAVSVRGFNAMYANKLLVLIDGRSIYNRIFSGVTWDTEDLALDDVERIEVIRGPGAAMWGANAVNAVINILTRSTADTQGGFIRLDAGTTATQGALRYGGTLGAATYRLYSQWTGRDASVLANGVDANDALRSLTTGFRADWRTNSGVFMFEGDFTKGQDRALWPNLDPLTAASRPIADDPSDLQGEHLLARWTHTRDNGATLQLQSFLDFGWRHEPLGEYDRELFDFDAQYHTAFGSRQDVVVGTGYRFDGEGFNGNAASWMTPAESHTGLLTAFMQDEIALFQNRLAVTLGSQVQYDSVLGGGAQPTARVMWKGFPHQRVWAASSRALRTPSLNETGFHLLNAPAPGPGGLPLLVRSDGNPALQTETFTDAEVGYRVEIGKAASIDVTGFVGTYAHLVTHEVGNPVVQFVPAPQVLVVSQTGNRLAATTRGLEISGHWTPVPAWSLDGSYSAFHLDPQLAATSSDPLSGTTDGSVPTAQWQIRSALSPIARATFNAAIFHVGPIVQLNVDGYTRADANAEWRFTNRLSAMAIGQNLFDVAHAEFGGTGSLLRTTEVARSFSVRLRWTFR
jgi:iron complex outermembrane receptor protein